ncbi:hypothetical protein E4U54_002772 [Claviceps lovelessii]|nr:hypothetical protein E4U54_002772 [Claviceps lovelessii]
MRLPLLALTTLVLGSAGTLADGPPVSPSRSAVPTAPPLHSFPPIAGASRIPEGIVPTTTMSASASASASASEPETETTAAGTFTSTSTSTAWAVPTAQARVGPVLGIVAALLAV